MPDESPPAPSDAVEFRWVDLDSGRSVVEYSTTETPRTSPWSLSDEVILVELHASRQIELRERATGRRRWVRANPWRDLGDAALSPNGRRLAMHGCNDEPGGEGGPGCYDPDPREILILDAETGSIQQRFTDNEIQADLTWLTDELLIRQRYFVHETTLIHVDNQHQWDLTALGLGIIDIDLSPDLSRLVTLQAAGRVGGPVCARA